MVAAESPWQKLKVGFSMEVDKNNAVTMVAKKPLNPEKIYQVAIEMDLGFGAGANEPLKAYAAEIYDVETRPKKVADTLLSLGADPTTPDAWGHDAAELAARPTHHRSTGRRVR